jgi:hypothetical protein
MMQRRKRAGRRQCPIFGRVHQQIRQEATELRTRGAGVSYMAQAPESLQLYDAAVEWLALHPEAQTLPYLGEAYQLRRSSIGRLVICWRGRELFSGPVLDV